MLRNISKSILLLLVFQGVFLTQIAIAEQMLATIPVDKKTFRSNLIGLNDKDFFVEFELEKVATQSKLYKCLAKLYERRSGGNDVRIDAGGFFGQSIDAKLMIGTYDDPVAIKLSGQMSLVVPLGGQPASVKIFATIHAKQSPEAPPESKTTDNSTAINVVQEYSLSGNFVKQCVRKFINANSPVPQKPIEQKSTVNPPNMSVVDPCSEDPDDMTMTVVVP